MIIKKIKLKNIRSYKEEELIFPKGSILLSGNIGSGKSTIFLAIDFVLFGISRELPGTALLRNGEKEGHVELEFSVNNNDITIRRNLKRGAETVSQDAGHIIINGEKHDLTAMELKQKILGILNYPPELLTKSKSMIYHYTVYSPQEKMKEILLSKKEDRLEILRKVFGIDKYKRVRDNTEIFITTIKQKSKEIAAMVADLEQKSEELSEQNQRKDEIETSLNEIKPEIEKLKITETTKKKEIQLLEEQQKQSQQIKHELEKIKIELTHKNKDIEKIKEEQIKLLPEIEKIESEFGAMPLQDPSLQDQITSLEVEIKNLEEQILHTQKKSTEFETRRKSHEKLFNDINSLEICPICKQNIDDTHKNEVSKKEKKEIEKLNTELKALTLGLEQNSEMLKSKKEKLLKTRDNLGNQRIIELKKNELNSKKDRLSYIQKSLTEIKSSISMLNNKKLDLESKYKENPELELSISNKKNELESFSENLKELEIKKASLESELKTLESIISKISQEVEAKKTKKDYIVKLMQLREWLEKQFINMTILMEKNIMLRVHSELESLIQKWFSILVDSETIKIRIDEEFTPIIEQNGYEIDYAHLSGGEKTAAALSYRLALNQVINTLMSTINTKDILMLDEPTDGFSQEQLERMRNILEDLNTKQTIIVSHDPKVESFVDTVIRLGKTEHSTKINI